MVPVITRGWSLPWLEWVLPLYSAIVVAVYYQPDSFLLSLAGEDIESTVVRFYFCCFALLCIQVVLALWNRELALVVHPLQSQ